MCSDSHIWKYLYACIVCLSISGTNHWLIKRRSSVIYDFWCQFNCICISRMSIQYLAMHLHNTVLIAKDNWFGNMVVFLFSHRPHEPKNITGDYILLREHYAILGYNTCVGYYYQMILTYYICKGGFPWGNSIPPVGKGSQFDWWVL